MLSFQVIRTVVVHVTLTSEALLNFFRIFFEFFLGLKHVHNRESDRLYNCNAHLIANSLPRLQRFVFFVLEPSAIPPRRFEIFFENKETPMSVQLPDTISLRNKDSAIGRFWARCTKVKFLSRTRLRIFLDHLESHNALSKPRRQSGASEPQRESEALLNFSRIFFEFFWD